MIETAMTKTELLALVLPKQLKLPKSLLNAAERSLSDAEVAAELQKLGTRRRLLQTVFGTVAFWAHGLLAYLMVSEPERFLKMDAFKSTTELGAVGFLLFCFISGISAIGLLLLYAATLAAANASDDHLRALTPIAGTLQCADVVYSIEHGGDLPRQWRDLVLAERNQLIELDCRVMKALRWKFEAECAAQAAKVARDRACRAAHGLPEL